MLRLGLALALMAAPSVAHAFCGTYVGQPGAELYANTSQVLMVRQGERTTLTLANDYEGDLTDFAMVIPVPVVLQDGDVRVADADLLDRFAEFTGPRLVQYSCSDLVWDESDYGGDYGGGGCWGGDDMAFDDTDVDVDMVTDPADSLAVEVESAFTVGSYDIVVLSSEDSADLVTWLQLEGYGVSPDAEAMLGEYIEAGSYFFAAKVHLDELPEDGAFLPPLQVSYSSPAFSLPIKLGTLNSAGSQDLVLYTVTDGGRVGVANYPEVVIADECMDPRITGETIGDLILDRFSDEVDAAGGAAWALEYGFSSQKCDPCPPGGVIDPGDLVLAGFEGDANRAFVSRIRVRYPASAEADLVLYDSGNMQPDQYRYIVYDKPLEEFFSVCDETGVHQGDGTCAGGESSRHRRESASVSPWLPIGFLAGVGLVGWFFRRRRD